MKIAAIIAGIAILGGGAWYMSSSKTDKAATNEPVAPMTATENDAAAASTSTVSSNDPAVLAKQGGKFLCTFSIVDANANSSGIVYIDGKKFRGDFKSSIKAINQTIESHAISDGTHSYTWTSASNIGYKLPVIDNGNGAGSAAMSGNLAMNGANAGWDCVAEKFSDDKFGIPAGIQFMESPAAR